MRSIHALDLSKLHDSLAQGAKDIIDGGGEAVPIVLVAIIGEEPGELCAITPVDPEVIASMHQSIEGKVFLTKMIGKLVARLPGSIAVHITEAWRAAFESEEEAQAFLDSGKHAGDSPHSTEVLSMTFHTEYGSYGAFHDIVTKDGKRTLQLSPFRLDRSIYGRMSLNEESQTLH